MWIKSKVVFPVGFTIIFFFGVIYFVFFLGSGALKGIIVLAFLGPAGISDSCQGLLHIELDAIIMP